MKNTGNLPQVAIIGYGFAGRCFHAYLVGLEPRLHLRGIASRNPQTRARIQAEQHCHAYDDLDAVLRDPDVDLVIIASPNALHAEQSIAALQAGKHVVTDKVMCLSLADCDAMIAAADNAGKLLTVFQNRRWDGDFLTLQSLMARGEAGPLGTTKWVEVAWHGFGAWGGWRGQAEMGGGRFYDLGAHLIDQLCVLFPDDITHVYGRITRDFTDSTVESEALVVIEFAGGQTGVADLSSRTAVTKPRFLAHGSKATWEKHGLDPQEKAMIAGQIESAIEAPANYGRLTDGKTETRTPTQRGDWTRFYANIADVLIEGAPPAVSLPSLRRQIAVMDAARQQ
jgi:scyllo-inositol 2-dehydrogenase (NADP+)